MIRIIKSKKCNPETAEFRGFSEGWHVTKPTSLTMILKSGYLKPNSYKNLALFGTQTIILILNQDLHLYFLHNP